MGIRTKNLQHYVYHLKSSGAVSAANDKDHAVVRFPGFITNIYAKLQKGGLTTETIVDLNKNGTTVFATSGKITFTNADPGVPTYAALTTNPTVVAAGDILSIDADTIATTATNLAVLVTVSRTEPGKCSTVSDHDDVL